MRCCSQSLRAAAASASGPLTRRPKRLRSSAASISSLQGAVATAVAWCVSAAAAAVAAWRALRLPVVAMAANGSCNTQNDIRNSVAAHSDSLDQLLLLQLELVLASEAITPAAPVPQPASR